MTVNGKPLDDAKTYTLAVSTFVAEGGDSYAMLKDAPRLINAEQGKKSPDILRAAVVAAKKGIAPQTDGRISQTPPSSR